MAIKLRPLSYPLGAEVCDIDVSAPMSESQFGEIYQAFLDHCILLFRNQDITREQHIELSRRFGELDRHDAFPSDRHPQYPELMVVTNDPAPDGTPSTSRYTGRRWHTDMSQTLKPAAGSLLRCWRAPEVGGDTQFANMYRAYDALSSGMQKLLGGLHAVHYAGTRKLENTAADQAHAEEQRRISPPVAHPVVRISLATSVPLYKTLPYDPLKDFAAIGPVGQSFYVLAVHPSLPVNSVQELIAMAKAKPKHLSYASAGTGTITHFTVELFMSQAKVDMLHVPFKRGAPALVAFIGGQVQVIFNPIAEILPQIRAGGKVRSLAVTSPKRSPDLPNVPALAESVLPGFAVTPKSGIYAPAGTPKAIVDQLNAELNRMLAQADMRERLQVNGLVPVGGTPAELNEYLKSEIARWSKVAREAGVKPE